MTAASLVRLVVSCPPNHPSGQRSRAGETFTKVPRIVEVTPEAAAAIEKDPYLTVHKRTSRAWFTAHGLEFTEENVKKYADKLPDVAQIKREKAKGSKTGAGTSGAPAGGGSSQDDANTQQGGSDEGGDGSKKSDAPEFDNFAKKDDVIAALVKYKGKKAGDDFNSEASRDSLLELYRSLPDVQSA